MVVRYDRRRTILRVLGSVAFVPIGIWMIKFPASSHHYSPEMTSVIGWACIVFFSAAGAWGLVRLLRGVALELDVTGFSIISPLSRRARHIAWRNVAGFRIEQIRHIRFVTCRLLDAPLTLGRLRGEGGGEVAVPNGLELSPDQVMSLLEDWRSRYGQRARLGF